MTQYYDDTAREYAERAEAAAASAHQSKQQASTAATTATTQANIAVNAAANATTLVKSDLEAAVGQMKQDALSAATQSSDAASAASGSAVTASQAAIEAREWATRASASAVAAAGSTTMANQAAAEAHDWAVQAMNYIPLELQAPPTQTTAATLGRLALWHDETAGVYHAYHLVGITEGDNPEYQWEECVLEAMLGVPDGVATLDANGKVPASQLPSGQGAEPVILDAPPTTATEGTLGQLGLWRDATNNTDHVYVLVFTSTSAGATMYHWDECVLESARNVPDGFAGLDANGKVAPAQLPVPAGNNIGAVKANTAQGTQVDNSGYLTLTQASVNEINTRATNRKPIIPSTLNHAVTAALTDENHITLDAAQQATAQTVFNVPGIDAAGASLGLSIDPQTYVMTLALKNAAGDTLDTKTVDLPLETMVVSASYANGILTLTLQSGATTDIDISALVDGLIPASEKGAVNGVATLGNDGKVPSAQLPTIPTALSQLTADSTHRTVTDAEKQTWNAKSDFSGDYDDLTDKPTIPSKTSDLTNDSGFQTASDVQTAISGKADESALTAHTGNTTIHVTAADKTAWNAKSDFSGSYNDLTNKPDIPDSADDIGAIPATEKGANNGVATLGNDGKVPSTQLPPISSVPDPITALVDPTNTTVGVLGQLYLNTYADKAFVCAGSYNAGTAQAPSLRYGWMPIVAGSGGTVWKNVIISQLNNNTVDTASKPVLIVGNSNTQSQALASTIVGHDITQNVCNQSAAVGQHITQNGCGDSLAIGLYISQRVCEAVLMSGLYLTSDSGVPEGASYFGKYNAPSSGNMRVTGGGTADNARKNIEELSEAGDLYITGGYRQGITVIPAATAAYTLSEGVFTHAPASSPTYTLPAVTDTTRTHRIELTVDFTTVQTYAFVDSTSAAVTPVSAPTIAAGDIITFKMEYSSVLNKWLVYAEKHGEEQYVALSQKGVANGVATLGSDGKVPAAQLPPSSGVPAALHGNADPTINTVGVPGQLYFNYTAGTVFACCVVNTVDTDVYQYVWAPVVANAGGYVGYYLLVGAPNTYTKTAQTQYVLAIGSTVNQSDAGSSLAVGSNISQATGNGTYPRQRTSASIAVGTSVTQTNTYGAGAIGYNITQTGGFQNFAAGNGLTQNGSSYCTVFGHNNSQNDSCLTSLVNGLLVTQTNGEGVLMSGIYLTNTAYKSGGSYFGLFNAENANAIRITGYGSSQNARKNIEELSTSGDLYITGGHQQQITTIPTATTAYTLAEGVYVHVPATVATYTLPTPADITRTHEIIIDVEFSADTSVTFQDSSSVEIEPLSEPETEAGTVVSYLCRFSLLLYRWVIMPVVQGVAGA